VKEDPKILGKSTSATEVPSKLDKAANTNNSIVSNHLIFSKRGFNKYSTEKVLLVVT
jgi:hypothetical protein